MKTYTDSQLLDKVKSLPDYKGIPQGHWILGVRSLEDKPDAFDDKFYHFIGETFRQVIKGTTNPGVTILKSFGKFNPSGAAVVKSDEWYYDLWKFGKHHGKVDALNSCICFLYFCISQGTWQPADQPPTTVPVAFASIS